MQQAMSQMLPSVRSNLMECVDGFNHCDDVFPRENSQTNINAVDATYNQMMAANVILGIIWWAQTWVPITAWYAWQRPAIRAARATNWAYHLAWNFMWMSHFFIYQLPAIIFPFTFFHIITVNQMYILVNHWIGKVVGGMAVIGTEVLFALALVQTSDWTAITSSAIIVEMVLYLFFTVGLGLIVYEEIEPLAYEYLQWSLPAQDRDFDGTQMTPEGMENRPIGAFTL